MGSGEQATANLFDNKVPAPATPVVQWYLLRAIALNGNGCVPIELLTTPWTVLSNSREKYWWPTPVATWAVAQLGQANPETSML